MLQATYENLEHFKYLSARYIIKTQLQYCSIYESALIQRNKGRKYN